MSKAIFSYHKSKLHAYVQKIREIEHTRTLFFVFSIIQFFELLMYLFTAY